MKRVLFSPEVEDDLYGLFRILYEQGYLGTYDFAWDYVQDIVYDIVANIDTKVKYIAPDSFSKIEFRISFGKIKEAENKSTNKKYGALCIILFLPLN